MSIKAKAYLAGRMGTNPHDREWRKKITPFLEELGFEVLDPYVMEPLQLAGLRPGRLPDGIEHWYQLRDSDDPQHIERFMKYMRRIIHYDIHLVQNEADVVIVYWDKGCRNGAGTHSEMTSAYLAGKSVLCVMKHRLPAWARGCCEEVFESFDSLKKFLQDEYGREETDKGRKEKENKKS